MKRGMSGQLEWECELRGPNGSIVHPFLVDTGASDGILSVQVARRLGLPKVRSQQVATANGVVTVPVVRGEINVEGCGWYSADFFATDTTVWAIGWSVISLCGLSIPPEP